MQRNDNIATENDTHNQKIQQALPPDVFKQVAEYLTGKELTKASAVSKYFHTQINQNTFFTAKINKEKENTQPRALIEKFKKFVEQEVGESITYYKINRDNSDKVDSVDFCYTGKNGKFASINYGWSMIKDAISEDTNISYLRK